MWKPEIQAALSLSPRYKPKIQAAPKFLLGSPPSSFIQSRNASEHLTCRRLPAPAREQTREQTQSVSSRRSQCCARDPLTITGAWNGMSCPDTSNQSSLGAVAREGSGRVMVAPDPEGPTADGEHTHGHVRLEGGVWTQGQSSKGRTGRGGATSTGSSVHCAH